MHYFLLNPNLFLPIGWHISQISQNGKWLPASFQKSSVQNLRNESEEFGNLNGFGVERLKTYKFNTIINVELKNNE